MLAPEHDPRKLRLPPGDLALACVEAFDNILRYADRVWGAARTDPVRAVHEYRKSLRRARSLLRALRPILSNRATRQLDTPIKAAHRKLSPARDQMVMRDAWNQFAAAADIGSAATPPALAAPAPRAMSLPDNVRRDFGDLVELLEARLPDVVGPEDLAAGLARTYRSARRALERADAVADPIHVHALRRRIKDLNYQLELVAPLSPKRSAKWGKRFSKLAEKLGEVTDLYQLRTLLAGLGNGEAGDDPVDQHLRTILDERIDALVDRVLARARKRLRRKPGDFAAALRLG